METFAKTQKRKGEEKEKKTKKETKKGRRDDGLFEGKIRQ
jgi:hypothetical protein